MILLRAIIYLGFSFFCLADFHQIGGGIKFVDSETYFLGAAALIMAFSSSVLIDLLLIKTKWHRFISCSLFILTGFGYFYLIQAKTIFSYTIVANHLQNIFGYSGFYFFTKIIYELFFAYHVFWVGLCAYILFLSYKKETRFDKKITHNKKEVFLFFSVIASLLFFQINVHLFPISGFFKSYYDYHFPKKNIISRLSESTDLLETTYVNSQFSNLKKPHIFLVMIESLNSRFINRRTDAGEEFTPFLNSLARDHLYLENYFSNSVYTSKSHFSIFCGQIPMLYQTEFITLADKYSGKCLAENLKEHNYKTHFFQADSYLDVDNTRNFLKNHGIDEISNLNKDCGKSDCKGHGLTDVDFYNNFFSHIKKYEKNAEVRFFSLATIQNHMPFTFAEKSKIKFHAKPTSRLQNYENSVFNTDQSLKVFFDLLNNSSFKNNSIVIITGDHGFPLGEHGSDHNENYAYQENFGVPLLIVDNRSNLKNNLFSHLNLAPTIIDLAGISLKTDYIKNSIFSDKLLAHEPVYLIQPHSGAYQAVVEWPYKYIYHQLTATEKIYNLETDKGEMFPLDLSKNKEILLNLRKSASVIYKQQEIFLKNNNVALYSPFNTN